jgi:hypothetical protein
LESPRAVSLDLIKLEIKTNDRKCDGIYFSKSKMTKFVYVRDQNALIALVQSTSEARDIQAIWLSVQVGLSRDEFEELPAPKQKLSHKGIMPEQTPIKVSDHAHSAKV